MARIAINGLGRIGRAALKIIQDTPELELVAVNDIVPVDNIAYLLKYDSAYGRYHKPVEARDGQLVVDGHEVAFLSEKDPAQLPWDEMDVDIVLECTGVFDKRPDLEKHIHAGARYVILSAPAKSEDIETIVYGVSGNDERDDQIRSCASCTTNCITPVVEILGRHIGVEKAMLTTIHAYTASQSIVDAPAKKMRRGRAGAANLVPTTTGAAVATTKALPEYAGRFDGVAVRAPNIVGSIADLVFLTSRDTSVEEINRIFTEEAQTERYQGVVSVQPDEVVSTDIIGDPHASIIDLNMTQVVDGNLVKIMSWYDNEWGYSSQMVREARQIANKLARVSA
jgi:glyceraldehyde 3-phosphate dehydrogenase